MVRIYKIDGYTTNNWTTKPTRFTNVLGTNNIAPLKDGKKLGGYDAADITFYNVNDKMLDEAVKNYSYINGDTIITNYEVIIR
jgi:hypothetical protein